VLDCFYCLSLWVALPIAASAVYGLNEQPSAWSLVLQWLALSGGAILLERVTAMTVGQTPTSTAWQDASAADAHEPDGQALERPDEYSEPANAESVK
jgi:hypothetical protein